MAETATTPVLADQFELLAQRWVRLADDIERVEEWLAILNATERKVV